MSVRDANRNDFLTYANEILKDNVVCEELAEKLDEMGFFEKPASLRYHGTFNGGLYEHSKYVYYHLDLLTEKLGLHWERPESPFIIAMFHDLVKCIEYYRDMEGAGWKRARADRENPISHAHTSVMIVENTLHFKLTHEERLCIEMHMGPYEYYDTYSMKVRDNQNVLWVHTADMLAAQVDRV